MPRFSFKCHKCEKEMIIYVHEVKDVDPAFVRCESCDRGRMALVEFSMEDAGSMARLQAEIEELHRRIEALGADEPEETEIKTLLN